MIIGVPKEIKDKENRVGMTPAGVEALVNAGHSVLVERAAGLGSGFADKEYSEAGAEIVACSKAWGTDLVIKVKEPQASEYEYLSGQMVFTYFHLAGVTPDLTRILLDTRTTAIAYETVENVDGKLPLLAPMSAVAGNMAVTMGAYYLAKFNDGRGTLLGRVVEKPHGKVVIIGDGVVGRHAAAAALGLGSKVYMATRHTTRESNLKTKLGSELQVFESSADNLTQHIAAADLVVGAVLTPGAKAQCLISESMVKAMQLGSVIVDVSIDQGGCVATARPTSHSSPVYVVHGVTHYCVTNMPGAYPRTSTVALTGATLPYAVRLAEEGLDALQSDIGFGKGVNTHRGWVTNQAVVDALGLAGTYREFNAI